MIPERVPDGLRQMWFVAPVVTRDVVQETAARLCLASNPSLTWRDVYCHTRGIKPWLRGIAHGVARYRVFAPPEYQQLIQEIGMELVRKQFGDRPKDRRKNRR